MPHQPTRLPYGLSFVKPGVASGIYTITNGDTTPDVSMGTYFVAPNSNTTITNFDGGELGKIIMLYSNSSLTVLQNSAGGISLTSFVLAISAGGTVKYSSTGNYMMTVGETKFFVHNGSYWSEVAGGPRYTAA